MNKIQLLLWFSESNKLYKLQFRNIYLANTTLIDMIYFHVRIVMDVMVAKQPFKMYLYVNVFVNVKCNVIAISKIFLGIYKL